MTAPILGPDPEGFTLHLPIDEDFVAEIEIPELDDNGDPNPPLDPSGSVRLWFYDATPQVEWLGTLVETDPGECRLVLFNVDEAEIDTLRAARPRNVRLQYILGAAKLPWAKARVRDV